MLAPRRVPPCLTVSVAALKTDIKETGPEAVPAVERTMLLRGRNLLSGLPQSVEVSSIEVREALAGPVHIISDAVREALDETPPELVADLMEHGVALVGGGALLQGLAQRLTEETRMKVYVAAEPLTCVAKGAGKVVEELDSLRKVLSATHRDGRWRKPVA